MLCNFLCGTQILAQFNVWYKSSSGLKRTYFRTVVPAAFTSSFKYNSQAAGGIWRSRVVCPCAAYFLLQMFYNFIILLLSKPLSVFNCK